jgi:hypothetical protein
VEEYVNIKYNPNFIIGEQPGNFMKTTKRITLQPLYGLYQNRKKFHSGEQPDNFHKNYPTITCQPFCRLSIPIDFAQKVEACEIIKRDVPNITIEEQVENFHTKLPQQKLYNNVQPIFANSIPMNSAQQVEKS